MDEQSKEIKNKVRIPIEELSFEFFRSSGPGGQNVNKVSTGVRIRWNIKKSSFLADEQKEKIIKKHPNKITKEGELIVECEETRSQFKNKEIALLRLCNLINKALKYKKRKRRKIKVPKHKKEERLQEKKAISRKKELRSKIIPEEET